MLTDERFYLKKKHIFWTVSIVAFLCIIHEISSVLLPFYIAFFEVILFNGLVNTFERKFHVPRAITAGIVTIGFCALVVAICVAIIPFLYGKGISVFNYTTNVSSMEKLRTLLNDQFSSEKIIL